MPLILLQFNKERTTLKVIAAHILHGSKNNYKNSAFTPPLYQFPSNICAAPRGFDSRIHKTLR